MSYLIYEIIKEKKKKNDKVYQNQTLRNCRKTYWYAIDVSSPGLSAGKSCFSSLDPEKPMISD